MRDTRRIIAIALVFGLGGFAALVYQVAWQRILVFQSGVGIHSVALIVAVFMAGLGLGAYVGGRLSARVSAFRALLAFAGIELLLGCFALVSSWIYYDVLYAELTVHYGAGRSALLLHFVALLPPTTLMGMSLPLLVRATLRDPVESARTIGLLYGVNVLGAAFGALLTPWVLIRFYGIDGAIWFGALCNLLAGVAVLFLARSGPWREPARAPSGSSAWTARAELPGSQPFGVWVALYAVSGFCALALEILWFRIIDVAVKSTAFTFGTVLAFFLAGLAAGSLFGGRFAVRLERPLQTFLTLQCVLLGYAGFALVVLVNLPTTTPFFSGLVEYWGAYRGFQLGAATNWEWILKLYVGLPLFLYGLPTFLMGLSFCVLQRAVQDDVRTSGFKVGALQAANIGGNVAGSLLTGIFLLSWTGTAGSFRVLLFLGFGFAALGIFWYGFRGRFGALAAVLLVVAFVAPSQMELWQRLHGAPEGGQTFIEEDGTGVAVISPDGGRKRLSVNGKGHSWLPFGNMHSVLGALPAALHAAPVDVAIVGLGSGDTAWAAGFRPETRRVVVFEVVAPERSLLEQVASPALPDLQRFLADPRLDFRVADGRNALLHEDVSYDLIEADALRPTSAYSGNVYSVEFFELAAKRLKPGGVMCTWAPTPRIRAAFMHVFPHVLEFQQGRVLLGSRDPIEVAETDWQQRLGTSAARDYLGPQLIEQVKLVAGTAGDATELPGKEVPANRDLFPRDEFLNED